MSTEELQDMESRIIEAAKRVFVRKGYEATKMGDIAADVGISRTAMHYYFRTKEMLFDAIFGQLMGALLPNIEMIVDEPVSCLEKFVLSKQMLRSGTAIGALLKEAEHAQSKADFISKVNIALKEANETEYWIMLLKETDYLSEKEYESIIEDCRELIKLTVSIVKTSKQNMNGTSK